MFLFFFFCCNYLREKMCKAAARCFTNLIYAETNSDRLPPYHRLDLRVSKTFQFGNWKLGTFLELLNAYNRANLLDFNYPEDCRTPEDCRERRNDINQLPIIPYLGITAEF